MISFSKDATSSGQVGSKVWLCHQLEKVLRSHQPHEGKGHIIWIYGGWVGLLAFLLFTRQKVPIQRIVNFDRIQEDLKTSELLNDYWHWKGTYRAIFQDVSEMDFGNLMAKHEEPEPHVIINTSVEHMLGRSWFDSLPPKKMVAIQSTDMKDDDHVRGHGTLEELEADFPISDSLYRNKLFFDYKSDTNFTRFMNIGFK